MKTLLRIALEISALALVVIGVAIVWLPLGIVAAGFIVGGMSTVFRDDIAEEADDE